MSGVRIPLSLVALSCAQIAYAPCVFAGPHDALISKHAAAYGVPESLVRRVIHIESRGNARAVSKGNYGLMQIRMGTARAMGYRGTEQGLLDPDTNMTYAVKYLAGAYRAAGCSESRAISYYQRGYYGTRPSKCSIPQPAATQIAERPEEKILAKQPRARAERATVAARAPSEPTAPPAGDVLTPRVVQTQTISRSKPELKPELAAKPTAGNAGLMPAVAAPALTASSGIPRQMRPKPVSELAGSSEPAHAPSAQALALKDVLTPPVAARSALEPATTKSFAAPAPEAVPVPRARPARAMPAAPAVAALDAGVVPIPVARPEIAQGQDKEAKPAHSRTLNRVRSTRTVREEPGLLASIKRLFAPAERSSRTAVTRR